MQTESFQDAYISLTASHDGCVTPAAIRSVLDSTGLDLKGDARLRELDRALPENDDTRVLTAETFSDIMTGDGGLLAMRALQGSLAIPDFSSFRDEVGRIFEQVAAEDPVGHPPAPPTTPTRLAVLDDTYPYAKNADYIPALSTAEDAWGVTICTVDGQLLSLGDSDQRFSIQSCCKPINYCQALESFNNESNTGSNAGGSETAFMKLDRLARRAESRKINRFDDLIMEERALGVHDYIDCEPSGQAFNAFSFNSLRMPYNPMINAGAIMCAALVSRAGPTDIELEQVQRAWQRLAGTDRLPIPDTKTAKGENRTGSNNKSIAYKMLANEAFPAYVRTDDEVESVLDFYFHCCALMLHSREMATAAATLANRGICPTTGDRVFAPGTVKDCLAAMLHCGMYDSSGRFGRVVGLPAKSGVGGAIMLVVPGVMGVCTFSPRLDKVGNSLRGLRFIRRLLDVYKLHMLDASDEISAEHMSPDVPKVRSIALPVQRAIAAAELGDVSAFAAFERLAASPDAFLKFLNSSDYDHRTPLHLAVCGGHADTVKYLLEKGVNPVCKDRWGSTPLDEAIRLDDQLVIDVFNEWCPQARGHTARHESAWATAEELHTIRNLFDASEHPHRTSNLEDLELIWAAAQGDIGHTRRRAARGARLLIADYDDRTPLHLACAEGQVRIVRFIIRYFHDVLARLHDPEVESRLGYYLSWPDRWGRTPLDDARVGLVPQSDQTPSGRAQCADALVSAGAFTLEDLRRGAASAPQQPPVAANQPQP